MPTITKIKALTGFAGRITAGTGATVSQSAGVWTVSLDTSGLNIAIGPSGATDNAVARFDGVTGLLLQNSTVTLSDAGILTLPGTGLVVGSSTPFSDTAGALILQNVDEVDATTRATILSGMVTSGVRSPATAARTVYVRANGSDSNNGAADTAGGAFLTLQKAVDVVKATDLNGYAHTIRISGGGTFAGATIDGPFVGDDVGVGGGLVTITGETAYSITGATNATPIVVTFSGTTPSNGEVVVIQNVGGNTAANGCWTLAGASGATAQLVNSVGNGAYTSGGSATFTSRTVIHGTAAAGTDGDAAIKVSRGAAVNISGVKLKSTNVYAAAGIGGALFINGPTQLDSVGSSVPHLWGTQKGNVTINAPIAVSAGGYNLLQASHDGDIRWNTYPIEHVANAAFTDAYAFSDYGDITGTNSVTLSTRGYTVTTAFEAKYVQNGIIQINGNMPPATGFFPGTGVVGIWGSSTSQPGIYISGSSSNVDTSFVVLGTGAFHFRATTSGPAETRYYEDADNGSNYVGIIAPSSLASNFTVTLPAVTGTLVTNNSVNVVGNSVLAQMAANTIKGNNTGSTANAADLTVAQTRAFVALNQIYITQTVDFNAGNTDTSFTVPALPTGFTRYIVASVRISGASASLTTATCGLFTAAAGGGVAIVTGASAITVSTASDATANNSQALAVNNANVQSFTLVSQPTLFFRVATPQGSAATGSVTISIAPVP